MKFNWKRIILYHLRWQAGFFLAYPITLLLLDYFHFPYWLMIITFQFVGALVFYMIDYSIFKKKETFTEVDMVSFAKFVQKNSNAPVGLEVLVEAWQEVKKIESKKN